VLPFSNVVAHGAMRLCLLCIARIARRANLPQPRAIDLIPKSAAPSCRLALTRGAYRDRHGRWARDAMDA